MRHEGETSYLSLRVKWLVLPVLDSLQASQRNGSSCGRPAVLVVRIKP